MERKEQIPYIVMPIRNSYWKYVCRSGDEKKKHESIITPRILVWANEKMNLFSNELAKVQLSFERVEFWMSVIFSSSEGKCAFGRASLDSKIRWGGGSQLGITCLQACRHVSSEQNSEDLSVDTTEKRTKDWVVAQDTERSCRKGYISKRNWIQARGVEQRV